MTIQINSSTLVTLAVLNAGADPKSFGGSRLGDDGQNELWLFGEKVANRFCANDPNTDSGFDVYWDNDVAGWNYNPETDAIS
jgi:hypothetical protein